VHFIITLKLLTKLVNSVFLVSEEGGLFKILKCLLALKLFITPYLLEITPFCDVCNVELSVFAPIFNRYLAGAFISKFSGLYMFDRMAYKLHNINQRNAHFLN